MLRTIKASLTLMYSGVVVLQMRYMHAIVEYAESILVRLGSHVNSAFHWGILNGRLVHNILTVFVYLKFPIGCSNISYFYCVVT